METPEDVAGNLIYDLGLEGALVYAKRKSENSVCSKEWRATLQAAIPIIQARIERVQSDRERRLAEENERRMQHSMRDDWV